MTTADLHVRHRGVRRTPEELAAPNRIDEYPTGLTPALAPDTTDAGGEPTILRVLVDDVRDFKDGRPAVVLRTSADAIAYVRALDGRRVDELWLDHDLVGDDTVQPLVDLLVADAVRGRPLSVARIWVHSSNIREGHRVVQELEAAGYPVQRNYAANLWRHSW